MSSHNIYYTNIKGPKKIWVSKVEKLSCDADNDTGSFSASDTTGEINIFYCSTPMMKEISLNNKKRR